MSNKLTSTELIIKILNDMGLNIEAKTPQGLYNKLNQKENREDE